MRTVNESELVIEAGGKGACQLLPVGPTAPAPAERELSGMGRIVALIGGVDLSMAEVSRLIALEIAGAIQKMDEDDPLHRSNRSMRDLNDQVKALRELQRTLTESEQMSKRDTLNIDGPKFVFVFKTLIEWFQGALLSAGMDKSMANNVMLNFNDIVTSRDAELRRDVSRIA